MRFWCFPPQFVLLSLRPQCAFARLWLFTAALTAPLLHAQPLYDEPLSDEPLHGESLQGESFHGELFHGEPPQPDGSSADASALNSPIPDGGSGGGGTETVAALITSPRIAGARPASSEPAESHPESGVPALEFHTVYKGDVWYGLDGALEDSGRYLGNIDLTLTIDGAQVFGIAGGTLFIHVLNDHGGRPNDTLDTVQGFDNIEVATHTSKIAQLWYQQQFAGDRLSLLAGLYDLNAEFYVTDSASVFIHPSFGVGAELAQTGANGPSIFPTTALALRARAQVGALGYAQIAVFDAVPGSEREATGTHIHLGGDGLLWAAEAGVRSDDAHFKAAVGFWQYTAPFQDLRRLDAEGYPEERSGNRGVYALIERRLFNAPDRAAVDGFLRMGVANDDINPLDSSFAAGLSCTQFSALRPDDVIGFGIAGAFYGNPYRRTVLAAETAAPRREVAYELTYRAQILPWLAVQPDLQWITRSGDESDALMVGTRLQIEW